MRDSIATDCPAERTMLTAANGVAAASLLCVLLGTSMACLCHRFVELYCRKVDYEKDQTLSEAQPTFAD